MKALTLVVVGLLVVGCGGSEEVDDLTPINPPTVETCPVPLPCPECADETCDCPAPITCPAVEPCAECSACVLPVEAICRCVETRKKVICLCKYDRELPGAGSGSDDEGCGRDR